MEILIAIILFLSAYYYSLVRSVAGMTLCLGITTIGSFAGSFTFYLLFILFVLVALLLHVLTKNKPVGKIDELNARDLVTIYLLQSLQFASTKLNQEPLAIATTFIIGASLMMAMAFCPEHRSRNVFQMCFACLIAISASRQILPENAAPVVLFLLIAPLSLLLTKLIIGHLEDRNSISSTHG